MRNKKIIIGVIAIIALIGIIFVIKMVAKTTPKKGAIPAQAKKDLGKTAAKKIISKSKGALTVIMKNSKNAEVPMKIKAFKIIDKKSSVYSGSTVGGRMQEFLPGLYDIEVDTVPQILYKNIKVNEGKETVEDLGCVTGSILIKTINNKKTASYYPIRVLYPNTNDMVTASMTNRAVEIIPGSYDIEIGTSPRQYKKNIKVSAGKEMVVDLGCITGLLLVKTADENKKDMRYSVRVSRQDTNEIVSSAITNKPIELAKGTYNIDVLSSPKYSKKDVKINTGEETVIEFLVQSQPVSAKPVASVRASNRTKR